LCTDVNTHIGIESINDAVNSYESNFTPIFGSVKSKLKYCIDNEFSALDRIYAEACSLVIDNIGNNEMHGELASKLQQTNELLKSEIDTERSLIPETT
jgi:hypothetical protein